MPGQFDLQQAFPIASVAQLYAQRPEREAAMKAQQQLQLVQGLQGFGQGVQSLVDRRNGMAQALAQAKLYSQTPDGQQVLGTNQVASTPMGSVSPNQTAAYDPLTGSVTPNQSNTSVADLATAFRGTKPEDFLSNMAAQRRQNQENTIAQAELGLKQKYEPQKLDIEKNRVTVEQQMQALLAGIKGREAATQATHTAAEDRNALIARRDALVNNLPGTFGTFLGNDKAQAAKDEIAQIDKELGKTGPSIQNPVPGSTNQGTGPVAFKLPQVGETVTYPNGVTIKQKSGSSSGSN